MSQSNKRYHRHLPHHRHVPVPTLFDATINRRTYRGLEKTLIYKLAKDNESLIQRMTLYQTCKAHKGCVNSICWNETGRNILSGSDDQKIKITDPFEKEPKILVDYKTTHRSNIFCARYLPLSDDCKVVTCSGDGLILFTDLNRTPEENARNRFNCHDGTCYKLVTVPNEPHTFLSCGEDHTVRFFDLRTKDYCGCSDNPTDVLINGTRAVTSMAVNPLVPWYLAVGTADSSVRIYDRRKLSIGDKASCSEAQATSELRYLTVPDLESSERYYRITSLTYSPCGSQVLASYSSDYLYLFDVMDPSENKEFRTELKVEPGSSYVSDLDDEMPAAKKVRKVSKPQLRRLRLRGDWSDTGPNARPQHQGGGEIAQARPTLQQSLMERMTFVLSQMLNDISNISGDQPSSRTNGHVNPPSEEGEDDEPGSGAAAGAASAPTRGRRGADDSGEWSLGTSSDQLEDQLASLRNSFVSRHNVEPGAVSLSYRGGGSNAGLISVSVGSESERGVGTENVMESVGSTEESTSAANIIKSQSNSLEALDVDVIPRQSGGKITMKFTGHRNARTMIKEANFYGDEYVMSGSDCGHVFIWEKRTGRIVQILEADAHVVNNVQPHPFDPIIATSGIDYDIKLFAPVSTESTFDIVDARELMKRNEVMLEETKDTITVPAAFMIRMLSCLSHIRRFGGNANGGGGGGAGGTGGASSSSSSGASGGASAGAGGSGNGNSNNENERSQT